MIYFFGDSFVDNEPTTELTLKHFGHHDRWYDLVSTKMNEEHKNLGIAGSGPQDAMKRFIKLFEKNIITSSDKVVMVLSNPYRLPMRWPGDEKGTIITGACLYDEYLVRLGINSSGQGPVSPDYPLSEKQLYCLSEIYTNMKWELALMNFKNVQLINFIAHKHKIKTILFNCFEQGIFDEEEIVLTKKLYESNKDDLFFEYPTSLFKISNDEWVGEYYDGGFTNHISKFAHETLSNIVVNYFNSNSRLSEVFKKNIFHTEETVNFIYE